MTPQEFITKLNEKGIPTPWARDPFTKLPSVSLTLLIVSCFYIQAAILSNWLAFLKGINVSVAENFFMVSCSLYFARKISFGGKTASSEKQE